MVERVGHELQSHTDLDPVLSSAIIYVTWDS